MVNVLLDAGAAYQSAIDDCARVERNAYHLLTLWDSLPLARALIPSGDVGLLAVGLMNCVYFHGNYTLLE